MQVQGALAARDAIARREELGEDGLRRALVSHGGWLVPASATSGLGLDGATAPLAFVGEEGTPPAGELWIFTDGEAAACARDRGAALGVYVAEVHGQELFGLVAPAYELVRVNPLCEVSITCTFGGQDLEWLRTASVEHAIESAIAVARGPLLASTARRLREHGGYIALRTGEGRLVTRADAGEGLSHAALAFSAEDCLKAFVAGMAPEEVADIEIVRLPGGALFREVVRSDFDGVLFNPDGPGPSTALSRDVVRMLAAERSMPAL